MIRSVILYLVLVGLPAIGLSAVLNIGRQLVPPASFGGSWRVEAWPDSVCLDANPDTLQLFIEQSGPSLKIKTHRGPLFTGLVEGEGFFARGPNRRIMRGTRIPAESDTGATVFDGMVTGAPCDQAVNTRIRATRLQLPAALTGH